MKKITNDTLILDIPDKGKNEKIEAYVLYRDVKGKHMHTKLNTKLENNKLSLSGFPTVCNSIVAKISVKIGSCCFLVLCELPSENIIIEPVDQSCSYRDNYQVCCEGS